MKLIILTLLALLDLDAVTGLLNVPWGWGRHKDDMDHHYAKRVVFRAIHRECTTTGDCCKVWVSRLLQTALKGYRTANADPTEITDVYNPENVVSDGAKCGRVDKTRLRGPRLGCFFNCLSILPTAKIEDDRKFYLIGRGAKAQRIRELKEFYLQCPEGWWALDMPVTQQLMGDGDFRSIQQGQCVDPTSKQQARRQRKLPPPKLEATEIELQPEVPAQVACEDLQATEYQFFEAADVNYGLEIDGRRVRSRPAERDEEQPSSFDETLINLELTLRSWAHSDPTLYFASGPGSTSKNP